MSSKVASFEDGIRFHESEIESAKRTLSEFDGKGTDQFDDGGEIARLVDEIYDLETELEKGSAPAQMEPETDDEGGETVEDVRESRIDDEPPLAVLTGNELGKLLPRGKMRMVILRDRAMQWYVENLSNKTIKASDGKEVWFNARGRKKTILSNKGDIVLRLVPAIEDILKKGTRSDLPEKTGSKMRAEMFSGVVVLDGRRYLAGVITRTDANGRRQYDLTDSVWEKLGSGDPVETDGANSASVPEVENATASPINLILLNDPSANKNYKADLEDKLRSLGLSEKVALELVDTLGGGVAGSYAARLMRIARDTAQDASFTLDHEAVHAMREMGLFATTNVVFPNRRSFVFGIDERCRGTRSQACSPPSLPELPRRLCPCIRHPHISVEDKEYARRNRQQQAR